MPDKKTTIHRVTAAPKRRSSLLDAVASVFSAIGAAYEAAEDEEDDRLERVREARGSAELDIDDLVKGLKDCYLDHNRLNVLEDIVSQPNVHLTCEEAARLLETFDHDTNRRRAAKMLGLCVTDRQNAYKMSQAFTFPARTRDFMP